MNLIDKIKTVYKINHIKNGKRAKLSIAQISSQLIDFKEIKRNLPENEQIKVKNLYNRLLKDTKERSYDYQSYMKEAKEIIKKFNVIAPFEEYSNDFSLDIAILLEDIKSGK